jgi:hypothetical protein
MDGFGLSRETAMPVPVSADTGVMAIGESSAMQASVADVALPAVPGDTQVAPPESTAVLFMMLAEERTDAASTSVRPVAPEIPKGWDGASPPLPGWTWRGTGPVGSNEGGWVPPKGSPRDGESIHKDTTPHDIGDHVDWTDRHKNKWKWVEDTGKWHPAEGNNPNRPTPIFPEGTLVPSDENPTPSTENEPTGNPMPKRQQPLIPFGPFPAMPKPPAAPVPIPGFGIPLFIIPIWPKPQDLIPGYYKGAPSMDFT